MAMIPLAFGSDLVATVTWPGGGGEPANLTGCTVEVLRASPVLAGRLTATITDAAAGKIALAMTWHESVGAARAPLRFSLRVTPPVGPRQASALIGIQIL